MINLDIVNARVVSHPIGYWLVMHPSNDAVLAYCDTGEEAREVVEALNRIANSLGRSDR